MSLDSTTKRCTACGEIKPLTDFNKNRTKAGGLAAQCRECMRAIVHAWQKANPEKYLESVRRAKAKKPEKYRGHKRVWAEANPDRVHAKNRRYAEAHPYDEVRREYFRKRYQQHKQRIKAYQRQYSKTHPWVGVRSIRRYRMLKGHKRIHGWPEMRAWFGNCCLCCGATKRIEADHVIPLSKGGPDILENLQPLCRTCNASKATSTIDYRDTMRLIAFFTSSEAYSCPSLRAGTGRLVRGRT